MEVVNHGLNYIYLIIFNILLVIICLSGNIQCRRPHRDRCLQCDQPHSFSFLWEIKRPFPSPSSHFFGTIHAPYTKVWHFVPREAKIALRNSTRVILELDFDMESLRSLSKCQMLPPGLNLSNVIPKDIYNRLEKHMEYVKKKIRRWLTQEQKDRGVSPNLLYESITKDWRLKRPIWVITMLNTLTENDIKSRGIMIFDSFLSQIAYKQSKEIGAVENAEEQCVTLNGLNHKQVLVALNQTLAQQEDIRHGTLQSKHTTDELIRHYNCGNLNEALFKEDFSQLPVSNSNNTYLVSPKEREITKSIEEYFRSEVYQKRNRRMSKRILELLASHPNQRFFFAFGAGHFLGPDSIIELMKQSGLEIIHINTTRKHRVICSTKIKAKSNERVMRDEEKEHIIVPVPWHWPLIQSGHSAKHQPFEVPTAYLPPSLQHLPHQGGPSPERDPWSSQFYYSRFHHSSLHHQSSTKQHRHSAQQSPVNDLLLQSYSLNKNVPANMVPASHGWAALGGSHFSPSSSLHPPLSALSLSSHATTSPIIFHYQFLASLLVSLLTLRLYVQMELI